MLLLPALNAMSDIAARRTDAFRMHPPITIFAMLYALALASSLLAGYGMAGGKSRSWLHIVTFAVVVSVAIYVILDLEYPRVGIIQVTSFDEVLLQLREGMR
jgi:hypothetical protein